MGVIMSAFLQELGVTYPIFLAPLAGGPSTPELAAAVSNAGGLGALGAAYSTPQQIIDLVKTTRSLTSGPLNVNLFAGGFDLQQPKSPEPMLAVLSAVHKDFGLTKPVLPENVKNAFAEQFEAVLEARPEVFSFTFGIPPAEAIGRLKKLGIRIFGTATTVEEGRMLQEAGAHAVIAQGAEAGGHRGTFSVPFEKAMIPTLELTRGLATALRIPVIASGGIMDGRDIVTAMQAGASAAMLGTAFLACPEAGTSKPYREALLSGGKSEFVITRAYSGRPARGLRNKFINLLSGHENDILPFPWQNTLTRALRTASAARGSSEYLSLWAGTGVGRIRTLPAGQLVRELVRETQMTRIA